MKNTPLILSVIALVCGIAALVISITGSGKTSAEIVSSDNVTAVAGDIVYIQLDSIVAGYDMYNDLMTEFQGMAQQVSDELTKKGNKWESDAKSFENSVQKGLLTRSKAEEQQQSLLQRQQSLQEEASRRQNELAEEESVRINQVMNAIQEYVDKYNAEKQFSIILSTSNATGTVITGNTGLNITEEILNGLNAEYVANRNK